MWLGSALNMSNEQVDTRQDHMQVSSKGEDVVEQCSPARWIGNIAFFWWYTLVFGNCMSGPSMMQMRLFGLVSSR